MRLKAFFTILALLFTSSALAALTLDQEQAKERGLMLFNQYKIAEPELRIAAEAGDAEAQYYLAEELRQMNRYITTEAYKWYEAAANQGHLYSMLRLSRQESDLCAVMNNCPAGSKTPWDWLKQAEAIAGARAEKGDGEAMYILYLATAKLEWLEKSAEAGYAQGQWLLANRYQEGEGFFFLPGKRQESVERWFKASAEGGNPKAMMRYAHLLYEKHDKAGVRYWMEEASKLGYVDAVSSYAAYVAHTPDLLGYELNLVKGYALTYLLKELDGGGNMQVYVDDTLPEIAAKMTPDQIEQAKVFAKEWKATHPPLSFFPDKLGY
ncbi:tetratricopeptide repeat protein [Pseudomonas sp. NCHU5208]|uniref:tetratricopeptide repeat protein n=1 Tax=unclassified Pseudomonas TaxID=196821 RepID=UPI003F996F61